MNIKAMPTVGFVTRSGRKVYGQNDYDRDDKINKVVALAASLTALLLALTGVI